MGIVSDLVFAIIPVCFLSTMHRPLMERILVSVLMGFGTIAAVAGGMKVYHINAYDPRRDLLRDWMPLLWWYRVEEIGLIIAACTPFLKPSIERLLARLGASPFRFVTIGLNTVRSSHGDKGAGVTTTASSLKWVTGEEHLAQPNPC